MTINAAKTTATNSHQTKINTFRQKIYKPKKGSYISILKKRENLWKIYRDREREWAYMYAIG